MDFDVTIMSQILEWGGLQVAGGILANTAFETFRNTSLSGSLKNCLKPFFDKDDEFDSFIEAIHNKECPNPFELPHKIDECYSSVNGGGNSLELSKTLKRWMEENKKEVQQFIDSLKEVQASTVFNIGSQRADKITNIGGNSGTININ